MAGSRVLRASLSALLLRLGSPFSAFGLAEDFGLGNSNEPCQARFEFLHRSLRVVYREFFRLDSLRHPLVITLQPRLCLGLELTPLFLHCDLADQFVVRKPLADDLRQGQRESARITKFRAAIVVAEGLLV